VNRGVERVAARKIHEAIVKTALEQIKGLGGRPEIPVKGHGKVRMPSKKK